MGKKYEEKAEAAKVKFQAEHKEWKEQNKEAIKENKKNKFAIQPPKRPVCAYAQWMADNRSMLTEKVMAKHGVDKAKAFLMLYKEARPLYDALPEAEKKKCVENAEAVKVRFQAEHKEWKEQNKGAKTASNVDEDEEGEEGEEELPPATKSKITKSNKDGSPPSKKPKVAATLEVEADVLNEAKNAGFDRQLKTLLEKPEIQDQKISAGAVLKALQDAGGKTVAAKKALLVGRTVDLASLGA